MWEPLTQREISGGSLAGSWVGAVEKSLIALLDPPRHDIGKESYRKAQSGIFNLYKQLQTDEKNPFPIALQEEFWVAFQKDSTKPLKNDRVDDYLDRDGFGIVAAIINAKKKPEIIRLEDHASYVAFEDLRTKAISFMEKARSFFESLVHSYQAASSLYSSALLQFKTLVNDKKTRRISYSEYLRQITILADSYCVEIPTEVTLYNKTVALGAGLDEAVINWERRRLEEEIKAKSIPGGMDRRAAIELSLYKLLDQRSDDIETEAEIEACREMLASPTLPFVPDFILDEVSQSINTDTGDFLAMAIRVDPEQPNRHKGHGDVLSRLLELGVMLGIDINKYQNLKRYVYHVNLHFEWQEMCKHSFSQMIDACVKQLESDLADVLATQENDRKLLELEPVMLFLEELTHFRIAYEPTAQEVITDFSAERVCRVLNDLQVALPAGWQIRAKDLDSEFNVFRKFNGETVRRGKILCKSLLEGMDQLLVSRAILCCDGYLSGVLTGLLKSQVSYSMLIPDFSLNPVENAVRRMP